MDLTTREGVLSEARWYLRVHVGENTARADTPIIMLLSAAVRELSSAEKTDKTDVEAAIAMLQTEVEKQRVEFKAFVEETHYGISQLKIWYSGCATRQHFGDVNTELRRIREELTKCKKRKPLKTPGW